MHSDSGSSHVKDKRHIERHQLHYYLQVYNKITDKPLGYIVNISLHGMMLVSTAPLLTHAMFELELRPPNAINGKRRIEFEALSHWCKPDLAPNCFDTGFSFTKPSEELHKVVEALSEYFSFTDASNVGTR